MNRRVAKYYELRESFQRDYWLMPGWVTQSGVLSHQRKSSWAGGWGKLMTGLENIFHSVRCLVGYSASTGPPCRWVAWDGGQASGVQLLCLHLSLALLTLLPNFNLSPPTNRACRGLSTSSCSQHSHLLHLRTGHSGKVAATKSHSPGKERATQPSSPWAEGPGRTGRDWPAVKSLSADPGAAGDCAEACGPLLSGVG